MMADEDDQWLYGDTNPDAEDSAAQDDSNLGDPGLEKNDQQDGGPGVPLQPPEIPPPSNDDEGDAGGGIGSSAETGEIEERQENGAENGEIEEDDDDDDDDSDEDNVHVTIGDINKAASSYTNINIAKRGPMVPAPGLNKQVGGKFTVEEFDMSGYINGMTAHDFNMEGMEDKPWRKPGADITDYFNYGFNEDTWKAYCERQKRLRVHESCVGLPAQAAQPMMHQSMPVQVAPQPPPPGMSAGKKLLPGWEPDRGGQIRVIGSGVASRRVDEGENIQTVGSGNFTGMPPPGMPPMGVPPPGFPGPPGDHYAPPGPDYFNPEPDYFTYEPTGADQWRGEGGVGGGGGGWTPGTLSTPRGERDRRDRERETERSQGRDRERDREREREREEKDKRRERSSHRGRSRSRSHERKRNKSRSRSPGHKKHKKKSKKSDRKKRSDESE